LNNRDPLTVVLTKIELQALTERACRLHKCCSVSVEGESFIAGRQLFLAACFSEWFSPLQREIYESILSIENFTPSVAEGFDRTCDSFTAMIAR
jgi:hypothetical protein